jgi:putative acyl-CoA dehydrogenase
MNIAAAKTAHERFLADTHEVKNVARELVDYNLFAQDAALQEAVRREGAAWADEALTRFGAFVGRAEYLELGALANRNPPELDTHDRFGNRVDLVRFHPAYHALMKTSIEHGLHSSPWTDPKPGAHVARAAHSYLHTQVDAGHGCPITMTFASVPSLRTTPRLAALWEAKVTARVYDPRNVPDAAKLGLTIGMAMTEKQGARTCARTRRAPSRSAPKGRARRTSSSATSSSSRRRCATRSSSSRRPMPASRASCCRAGAPTAARTRCRCCA